MAARWTSSPATASWRCSARRSRWRTTRCAPVWRRWASRRGQRLAAEVERRDGVDLQLRVGLNSGQVIAGEIGSAALGYTAMGEQVGMAQRMESVAPPGGVMLSDSTARLVEGAAMLGESELVHIKGADEPVRARRLLSVAEGSARQACRVESGGAALGVGRCREPCWIARSMGTVRWSAWWVPWYRQEPYWCARSRRWPPLVASRCSPPIANRMPRHSLSRVARLLRAATGVSDLDDPPARERYGPVPDADPEDLLLLDDLLGIADPTWRCRNRSGCPAAAVDRAAECDSLARERPAVFVVEDAHWIDAVSESHPR